MELTLSKSSRLMSDRKQKFYNIRITLSKLNPIYEKPQACRHIRYLVISNFSGSFIVLDIDLLQLGQRN